MLVKSTTGVYVLRVFSQLLREQVLKAQKVSQIKQLLGSASVKATRKMLAKLTTAF